MLGAALWNPWSHNTDNTGTIGYNVTLGYSRYVAQCCCRNVTRCTRLCKVFVRSLRRLLFVAACGPFTELTCLRYGLVALERMSSLQRPLWRKSWKARDPGGKKHNCVLRWQSMQHMQIPCCYVQWTDWAGFHCSSPDLSTLRPRSHTARRSCSDHGGSDLKPSRQEF